MKKYLGVVVLIGIIIWGAYDIGKNNTNSNPATVGAQNDMANSAGVSKDPVQGQNLTVGLEKGNLAPNFELQTIEGKKVDLSSYKGKKVILNFWASWCPPCRLEMPEMERYYTANKNKGIVILAVNLSTAEKSPTDAQSFIKMNNITFPVLLDEKGSAAQQYNISSIPASFILDTQGVIQQKFEGPMTYEMMDNMLGAIK